MSIFQKIKGYVAGAVALVACPCHLPITFPLLLTLTAGTAVGTWLTGNFWTLFGVSTLLFIVGLWLTVQWTRGGQAMMRASKTMTKES